MAMKAKDIAKVLEISPSTVSMVLNNKPGISEARRRQVIDKIHELGYNSLLTEKRSSMQNMGFLVYKKTGDIIGESPFFSLLIDGVSQQANHYGYNLMFIQMNEENAHFDQIAQINANNCRGLVIFATEAHMEDVSIFASMNIPFVILDNHFLEADVDTVCINNERGIQLSVEYLVRKGHRRIGYLRSQTVINSFAERFDCYQRFLHQQQIPFNPQYVRSLSYSQHGAFLDAKAYLAEQGELPTAFLADNDLIAVAAMKAFQESGLRIPHDISIIGYDNRPICETSSPRLSTISVPTNVFGPTAVDILVRRINSKEPYPAIKTLIGCELVERDSVAAMSSS